MTSERALLHLDDGQPSWNLAPHADADRWRVAYGILDLARLHSGAPHAALYVREADALHLLALRGIDQPGLDLVARLWHARELRPGRTWADDPSRSVVLPCDDQHEVFGLLLLRWPPGAAMGATAGLPSFARVVATLLQRLDPGASADARPPTLPSEVGPTASGVALRALLDEHEWNVSRVARLLSVTRMTVYNRLRRLGIARERVSKALKPRSKLPATR